MNKLEEKKKKRFQFLHKLYEMADYDTYSFMADGEQLGRELGFADKETITILDYLIDEYLIKKPTLSWLIKITHAGIKEVEEALLNPEIETHYFPPIINIINIERMENSQIQQGTINSTQTGNFSAQDLKELLEYIELLKSKILELELKELDEAELKAYIATIEAQATSSKPESSIIEKSLKYIQRILENASGSIVATELLKYLPILINLF